MRSTLLLLGLVAFAHCVVVKMPAHKGESPIARMIRDGTLSDFLAGQEALSSNAVASRQSFVDHFDGVYSVEMSIGTPRDGAPRQNFSVMLATAETDTFVIDARCNSDACTGKGTGYEKNRFDYFGSSTITQLQGFWTIQGRAAGITCRDVITVAGITGPADTCFGLASNATEAFGLLPVDGVFGLAWPENSIQLVPSVLWHSILPQLDAQLFTIWLDGRVGPKEARLGGQITYGALDNEHCDSQVDYVPLSQQGYWQFPITRFSIGSQSQNARVEAISDSASARLGAPLSALNAIIAQTSAKFDTITQLYLVPCSGSYPDIVFTIGGKQFNIPSSEYVVDLGLSNGKCALAVYELTNSGWGPDWNLGATWIRTYCNVYDIGQKRIGFAKSRHSK